MLRLVVFLAAVLAVQGQTTNVNRCTFFSGELPLHVNIEGCQQPPCQLPQLEDILVNIVFRAPRTIEQMSTVASAFLSTIIPLPIPYDLGENSVTCNFLQNSFCPVFEGEILIYQLRMHIESFMPVGTNANIEFRIVDSSINSAIMCMRVPISIVSPLGRSNATLLGGH